MKRYIQLFESWQREETIVMTSRMGRDISLTIRHGKIEEIENNSGIIFPFVTGQPLQIPFIKGWARRNGFKWNGEDACQPGMKPEKKIFGVRTKDVPKGHEWRHIFPGKFKD
jgi:hypothetical protein